MKMCKIFLFIGDPCVGKTQLLIDRYYHYKNLSKYFNPIVLKSNPGYNPFHFTDFNERDEIFQYNSEEGKCKIYSRNGRNLNAIFLHHFLKNNKNDLQTNKRNVILIDSIQNAPFKEFMELINLLEYKDMVLCFGHRSTDKSNQNPFYSKESMEYLYENCDEIKLIKRTYFVMDRI